MDLRQYFQRIHFHDTPQPDLPTLRRVHHQHLLHIPYENYDVQLRRPLDFDLQRIFNKLVVNQRGGWCYEMNGLLGWALQQIGFDVTRMSGGVGREAEGDGQFGNHLVLQVMLEQPYLADAGLGDGIPEPIPIKEGTYTHGYLQFRLEHLDDGTWRFHNHPFSNVKSFDFKHEPADENELSGKCAWLQTSSDSPFRQVLIAQRFTPEGYAVPLGKRFTTIDKSGKTHRDLEDAEAFNAHMLETFGINEDVTPIWNDIVAAHDEIFGA